MARRSGMLLRPPLGLSGEINAWFQVPGSMFNVEAAEGG
jgi:hypothetical protein